MHSTIFMVRSVAAVLMLFLVGVCSCEPSGGKAPGSQAKCLDVSQKKVQHIAEFMENKSYRLRPVAKAVRSSDYEKIYFIAAEIDAPGLEGIGDIGVWASNRMEPDEGLVWSISGYAIEFSVAPEGAKTKFEISPYSHGVTEARRCLEATQRQ